MLHLRSPSIKCSLNHVSSCVQVRVGPHEALFSVGDSSAPGIFIVVEGALGVYLQDGDQRLQTNVLEVGETVGDLDVLDGALLRE